MASEIRITRQTNVQNPSQGNVPAGTLPYIYNAAPIQMTLTQAVPGAIGDEFIVPTTAAGTALPVTNITTQGILEIANLDATNYVQWGVQVGGVFYPVGRANVGESWQHRLDAGCTLYVRSNVATVKIFYKLLEN